MRENRTNLKRGFTLIELMIVIGIIGILAAILLKAISGTSDSAQAAKCLANMHDLANACQAYALQSSDKSYPLAGSRETRSLSLDGTRLAQSRAEGQGWVSWASMGAYRNSPKESQANDSWFISTYSGDEKKRIYALTNGAIWKAISGNASSYRCPLHDHYAKKHGVSPVWSYVMNEFFGCAGSGSGQSLTTLRDQDRRLLFAELPFNTDLTSGWAQDCLFDTRPNKKLDPTLHYKSSEVIGFNHKIKRERYAHICFTDGHAERLVLPADASQSRLQELTTWLCEAVDIMHEGSFHSNYRKAK